MTDLQSAPLYVKKSKWFKDFKKEVEEKPDARKLKLWLANTEDLPLTLRVQAILGLYRKEILGK